MSPNELLRKVWQAAGGFPDAFLSNERSVLALVAELRRVAETVPNPLGALSRPRVPTPGHVLSLAEAVDTIRSLPADLACTRLIETHRPAVIDRFPLRNHNAAMHVPSQLAGVDLTLTRGGVAMVTREQLLDGLGRLPTDTRCMCTLMEFGPASVSSVRFELMP